MREFGELEMAIMDVMWAAESPAVVREVRERLRYDRPVAYTTVMTVMDILYRKGVLQRVKHGRAWRYWPVEQREEHDARVMTEILRSGGDEELTMRRFLERVSDDEEWSGFAPPSSMSAGAYRPEPESTAPAHPAGSPQL